MKVPFIMLYDDIRFKDICLREVATFLKKHFKKCKVVIRKSLLLPEVANDLAKIKVNPAPMRGGVNNLNQSILLNQQVLPQEIEYEKKRILDKKNISFGNIYDANHFIDIIRRLLPKKEYSLNFCHIFFTNQLIATYDENDKRYHLRHSLYSVPVSMISVTGIVEAPAKPRQYYIKKQMGVPETELKNEFKGRFIDYTDTDWITDVLKGLSAQAIFYTLTGDPFCKNVNCRLYNAHWQEELIQSQIKNKRGFCPKHHSIIIRSDEYK